MRAQGSGLLVALVLFTACHAPPPGRSLAPLPESGAPSAAVGTEIVVCGERFDVGVPVVLWFDEGGYSGYATGPVFGEEGPRGLRYQPGRTVPAGELGRRVRTAGWSLADLGQTVDLFVLHYDACGTSRTCFQVLHDQRQLSVHFLLDLDGTLYQTLDLKEQAWHARQANPRSIGIEMAQIGAYPELAGSPLAEWYADDGAGARLTIPARFGNGGLRTSGFRGRPARPAPVRGQVHGVSYLQYDFTPEQYESLARLSATLSRALPLIALDAPRDAAGTIRTDELTGREFDAYRGILGHQHVTAAKRDPGPAFDWERFLARARALTYSP